MGIIMEAIKKVFGTEPFKLFRADDPATSEQAAAAVDTESLEEKVYKIINASGKAGMISDEVREAMPDVSSYSSVTARYKALKDKGLVLLNGERRPGKSGRNQSVMIGYKHSAFEKG